MFNPSEEFKQAIRDWKAAAIADGWVCEPTYGNEDGRALRD